jgi:outer membrane protein
MISFCLRFIFTTTILSSLLLVRFIESHEADMSALSMEECVALATENNHTLAMARSKTRRAVANKREVLSEMLPHVAIEGVWDTNNRAMTGELSQFQDFRSKTAIGMKSYLGLWDFGSAWKRLRASRMRVRASHLDRDYTQLVVEEQVKTAYLHVLDKEKQAHVIRSSIHLLHKEVEISKDKHKQGLAKRTDVLTLQVRLAEEEKRLLKAQQEAASERMTLNHLIGLPLMEVFALKDVHEKNCVPKFKEVLHYGLHHRADLLAMRKQIAALHQDRTATSLGRAPKFFVFANGDYASDRSVISAGLGMTIPLYEGGKKRAQMDQLSAEIENLRAAVEDLKDNITIEIRNTFLQFDEIQKSLEIDKQAIKLAEENLHDTTELYRHGVLSVQDLLTSESQLVRTKMNYFSNIYRFHKACVHLLTVTGGFRVEE